MGRKRKEKSIFESARDLVKEDLKPIKEVIIKSVRKKKAKKREALCKYCKLFQGSDDRRLIKDGTSLIDYRKCPKAKKEVSDLTEACDYFMLHKVFWCDGNECWINIEACVSRNKKGEEGCVRCRQGKTIREIEKET
jgi:hypothetical protein